VSSKAATPETHHSPLITHVTPIRILIAYVSAGAGHRRAAEALAQAVHQAFPDAIIQCRDALEDVPRWWRRLYPLTYYSLVRYAGPLWGMGFGLLDRQAVYACVQPLRRAWNRLVGRRIIQRLLRESPDLVMATHFFPADLVSACKRAGQFTGRLVVVITDLYPHRFWLAPLADAYICATPDTATAAQRRGIPPERLYALGIPIASACRTPFDRQRLMERFQLDPARRTVLVTSGGDTVGPFEAVVTHLMGLEQALPRRVQLLIVCGADARMAERLHRKIKDSSMPARVFGFIDQIPEAMALSDIVVTKAGGLTVAEALGRGVPLIFYFAIPGHEWWNARHAVRHGAALLTTRPAAVARDVLELLQHPERLASMRNAAQALSRPDAAEAIVSRVVTPLLQPGRSSDE